MDPPESVSLATIRAAHQRLAEVVWRTPVLSPQALLEVTGSTLYFKAENLQTTGAFKIRGAANKLLSLDAAQRASGVAVASAGNHALAVAYAAHQLRFPTWVFMPEDAPLTKIDAVRRWTPNVRLVPGGYDDAQAAAGRFAGEEGLSVIPPFDDPDVIAGQGTVGLEVVENLGDVSTIVVPVGGGGLLAGVATCVRALVPRVRIVGVQVEGYASLVPGGSSDGEAGRTICDGIAVKRPGELTSRLIQELVDEVVVVSDDDAAQAMVTLLDHANLVVEGAGAVGLAAIQTGKVTADEKTCVLLTGGNVDSSLLTECIRRGETAAGRRLIIRTVLTDRPGALLELLRVVAGHDANILGIEHLRDGIDLHVRQSAVQLVLETKGPDEASSMVEAIRAAGFEVAAELARRSEI